MTKLEKRKLIVLLHEIAVAAGARVSDWPHQPNSFTESSFNPDLGAECEELVNFMSGEIWNFKQIDAILAEFVGVKIAMPIGGGKASNETFQYNNVQEVAEALAAICGDPHLMNVIWDATGKSFQEIYEAITQTHIGKALYEHGRFKGNVSFA